MRWLLACAVLLTATLSAPVAHAQAPDQDRCVACHALLDPPLRITTDQFAQDIHRQKGLNCASCHGGDPTADDPTKAMSRAAGFLGAIKREQIPALCARCHSDAAFMRQYNPSLRTDQLSQYQTSVHGKQLVAGDLQVAVCTDCHGVHDLRPARDSRSKVHPLNVAQTCSRCHADAGYMKSYKIPTDQFAGYSASVHHQALVLRGDLSAPSCTTCHGNHGAAPPGITSVEFVCSSCHVFQAQLFDNSPHKVPFAAMQLPGCVTCHSNHHIVQPTDALLGVGRDSLCTNCHTVEDKGYLAAKTIAEQLDRLDKAIIRADEVLGRAERSGMEVSQAKVEQAQARDALTKARVAIHGFSLARLQPDIEAGFKVTAKNYEAGQKALAERDYRRKGLAISLVTILAVLLLLRLTIRKVES